MLSRPLLERFHPLAIAASLCSPGQLKVLARRTVRELRHPQVGTLPAEGDAGKIRAWANAAMLREVERFAARNGMPPDQLDSTPARIDPECRSYCPRCHAQFTRADGACSDCGVSLVAYT